MKKMLMVTSGEHLSASVRAAFVFLLGLALASTFWMTTAPSAVGAEMTSMQMIASQLPHGVTIQTASKAQFLEAVCAAVKHHRDAAPQIVKAATQTGKATPREVVSTSVHCLGTPDSKGGVDCALIAEVVAVGVSVSPDDASAIVDEAIQIVPDCREAIGQILHVGGVGVGNFGNPAININPPPGSVGGGGGGFNPEVARITVCYNGVEVQVLATELGAYLRSHPGARVGHCQPTPVTNK
jgi:hypothetical protein